MHHAVLRNDTTEVAADTLNRTPPSFPVLAITHQTSKLPNHREDTEDGPQYVSCQGMCTVIFQQLAEIKGSRR